MFDKWELRYQRVSASQNDHQPTLFDGADSVAGKIPSLPQRTGLRRLNRIQRAGLRDPRLAECLVTLRAAVATADHEALLWVICAVVWWLPLEEAREIGAALVRTLDSEAAKGELQ